MRTLLTRLLAVFTAAVMTALLAPAAADAADFEWDYVTAHSWYTGNAPNCQQNFNDTAQGCFFHDGDYLAVADTDSDSMRAGLHWQTTYGRRGVCIQPHGKDADPLTYYMNGDYACNKNMIEGEQIRIRVGRCNGSEHSCTVLANWETWSGWSPWLTV